MSRLVVAVIAAAAAAGLFRPLAHSASSTAEPATETPGSIAGAQTLAPSRVTLADAAPIVVTLRPTGTLDARLVLLVKNEEATARIGHLSLFVTDTSAASRDTTVTCDVRSDSLPPGLTPVLVHLHSKTVPGPHVISGFIVVQIDSATTNAAVKLYRPIRIVSAPLPPKAQTLTIAFGLGVGILTVLFGSWRLLARGTSYNVVLQSAWAPSDSWASNFTILGLVFTTLLTVASPGVVLATMTRAEYTSLGALLTGIILLAPAAFGFLKGVLSSARGSRTAFVIASTFTLVGAFSQIALLVVLVTDIEKGGGLGATAYATTTALLLIAFVALLAFAIRSLRMATAPDMAPAEQGVAARRDFARQAQAGGDTMFQSLL